MKKIFIFSVLIFSTALIFAQASEAFSDDVEAATDEVVTTTDAAEALSDAALDVVSDAEDVLDADSVSDEEKVSDADSGKVKKTLAGISEVPASKRPVKADSAKVAAAKEKDESEETEENYRNTIKFGLPSEISSLLDDLIKNEDPRFTEEIYDLFQTSVNQSLKSKILDYFAKLEDPCLEDFAVDVMNDPYDTRSEVVKSCFNYIQKNHTKAAIPAILAIIESENETYFNDALATIGEIGDSSEAVSLAEYLDREDFSDAQRQTLMRTLGKIHATETYDKLVEILDDEDENTFVRMYAAESLGLMEKEEAVPVLVSAFSATDPNLRQYVLKGLSHFPKVVEAQAAIVQGIRDEHWKVRQEAIKSAKEMDLKDSVPYLIYRVKNDSEKVIREDSIKTLAFFNTKEANSFLTETLSDKKTNDATKIKIAECLLKEGHVGKEEVITLAKDSCQDEKKKNLRYGLGKEIAKYKDPDYAPVCVLYLSSKDATTVGLGLDMYKTGKYSSAEDLMHTLYEDKKTNSGNKNRIKKMLKIPDEEENKADSKTESSTEKKSAETTSADSKK